MEKALSSAAYERRLQQEIESLNGRISELTAEKRALERQLIKARQEMSGVHDVNRKNSVNRVMIERRVVDALTAKSPMSSEELYAQAKMVTFDLKASTFRTHLHRLKLKGVIETARVRGRWQLPVQGKAKPLPVGSIFD
ncbi:hypothetical protein NS365_07465 [Aureimonas ureilytica]|uniref:Uncharacterized protein n=1 Tax=Aureimonas ureilytica TaxID=401562 RepID=A0A175RT43_9HYPH|nr:helix-turn-helix transcriptional regulator [Aureimonas ureilytica]KTR06458.1 hypothetical protein NS365_07465 [Aureimonas ureilytica]